MGTTISFGMASEITRLKNEIETKLAIADYLQNRYDELIEDMHGNMMILKSMCESTKKEAE